MNLAPERMERIHALWDELADFDVGQADEAARHLMGALAGMAQAVNAVWFGAVRMDDGPRDDPLLGWRVPHMLFLHAVPQHVELARATQLRWNQRKLDPSFLAGLERAGHFSVWANSRVMPAEWFESDFFKSYWAVRHIRDAAYVGFPLNAIANSIFGFHRSETLGDFSEEDLATLTYALRGIKWFHRALMLGHGLMVASSPLTPAEKRVLSLLLGDTTEKLMARELALSVTTVHGHVTAIYRKFGVTSRAALTRLWLGGV